MTESLSMKTRMILAGASLQLISIAKKVEKSKADQKKVAEEIPLRAMQKAPA